MSLCSEASSLNGSQRTNVLIFNLLPTIYLRTKNKILVLSAQVCAQSSISKSLVTFEDHVRAALDGLPPHIASALRNVAVVVEDENADDPDVFGLYHGVPLPERDDDVGLLPDKISVYRVPLEESFSDPDELREEIRITVLHELGHYFGLDEDRIAELGYD
jgi:predicted Zn-dependent protease with MMP-like domain